MLKVNEIFGPTIQGEGKSMGKEVVFLRLAMCNIHCFKCDTPYTWFYDGVRASHVDGVRWNKQKETHLMAPDEVFNTLHNIVGGVRTIVISGGEPFLQQKELIPVLERLKRVGYQIEIETNGTIIPSEEFIGLIDQINCSPKLESSFSGEGEKIRIREKALRSLSANSKTNFKFVISEPENLKEALYLISVYEMKEVYFMPEGRSPEEIEAKKGWVETLCKEYNIIFSTRRHIELWGVRRAV